MDSSKIYDSTSNLIENMIKLMEKLPDEYHKIYCKALDSSKILPSRMNENGEFYLFIDTPYCDYYFNWSYEDDDGVLQTGAPSGNLDDFLHDLYYNINDLDEIEIQIKKSFLNTLEKYSKILKKDIDKYLRKKTVTK